ncbi:retrovirus-related pol polyprotein from transposon TNT 1-94, partial [Tanacetum coccineum]
GQARVVKCYNCQGEVHMARQCTQPKRPRNAAWYKDKAMLAEAQEAEQILDEEQLAFLADLWVPDGQAVPHFETYLNDMENQSGHAMQDFEQPPAIDFTDNEIHSDSNIIPYSQYLQETQQANVQDTHLQAQQDSIILSVIEQISEQMINHVNNWEKANNESKEKEDKYMENEIDLEKKIKELDNIIFKVGQSTQTVHMLTKPQAFYDNIHKQALGYQNPFYLRKAQRIKPTLYDGIVISDKHFAMHVIDDEETFILEEKSRSKMFEKAKDPNIINKNISHKPIDYEKLNGLSEDFGKRFTPQQEMDAEQAFWFCISNPTIESSNPPPVKVEVPSELSKNVKYDYGEIETKNVELENSVAKLILENERLCNEINNVKQVFKEQFDSIKKSCVHTKEQSSSLIDKLNLKSAKNKDLKAQIQDKVFVITSLNNDLRKIKGKEIVDIAAQIPSANTIIPGMFKLDLEPLAPRLLQNREAHIDYLKYTQEQADILWGIVEQAKAKQPLDKELDFACKHAQRIQELLVYVRDTCPNAINLSAKKVAVTPKNKVKKVRFAKPLTSLSNIIQVESSNTSDSNTPVLSSTGLKCSTSKCGSKPTGNKRNDRISQTPSRNMKNKVEAQPRKVNKKNRVVEPIRDINVNHSLLNANSKPICATCKKSTFDLDFVENVNSRAKSAKKHKKQNI